MGVADEFRSVGCERRQRLLLVFIVDAIFIALAIARRLAVVLDASRRRFFTGHVIMSILLHDNVFVAAMFPKLGVLRCVLALVC